MARRNSGGIEVRRCRTCGCTDTQACEGGCWWVESDLCSACKPLKYPLAAGQTNEYLVLHALEQNERTVKGIRLHIGRSCRVMQGVQRLSGPQVSSALQRLKADGLVVQHESARQCWFLRPLPEVSDG